MYAEIAMPNADIRIAHSLAVFEMRDCSPTVNDRHAPASGPSCCHAETGSTPMILRTTVSPMAMGKRRRHAKQASIWVATEDLPRSAAHPFYRRLNQIFDQDDFDGYVEGVCQRFYAAEVGRPGLPPGRYFRLLLIGYFEGLDAERAIAWRAADSFALREFLGLVLPDAPPDHSTISRTRRLIDLETHEAVFTWILQRLADAGLVKGKTIGIDATTLEANAALRSIVRRDTGDTYQEFLTQLAQASGIATPTREDLARIDRKRPKKGSNDDWMHPLDPDAKITKMKDGRTHLAHKAEHALDLETGAVVGVTVQDADEGDTITRIETLIAAAEQVETVVPDGEIKEVVADKGYHSHQVMVDLEAVGVRSYISEPGRGRRNWKDILTRGMPSTATAGGFAVHAGSDSCANAVSGWNGRAPTSMKPAGCAACTCGGY
jgi:transposase